MFRFTNIPDYSATETRYQRNRSAILVTVSPIYLTTQQLKLYPQIQRFNHSSVSPIYLTTQQLKLCRAYLIVEIRSCFTNIPDYSATETMSQSDDMPSASAVSPIYLTTQQLKLRHCARMLVVDSSFTNIPDYSATETSACRCWLSPIHGFTNIPDYSATETWFHCS